MRAFRVGFTLSYLIVGAAFAATPIPNDWSGMPLWACGVAAVPHSADKAMPPAPPGRKFNPALDRVDQLKPLYVDGSARTYSLVDLSDWQNVVDWIPNEHAPMPNVVQDGPGPRRSGTVGELDNPHCGYIAYVLLRSRPLPSRWNQFRGFGPTAARWDHHLPGARNAPTEQHRAVLYCAPDVGR
jgi:hypothetical protein